MINQEVMEYIAGQRQAGQPEEAIKQKLEQIGWKKEDIEEAFSQKKISPDSIYSDLQYSGLQDIGKYNDDSPLKQHLEFEHEKNIENTKLSNSRKKIGWIWLMVGIMAVIMLVLAAIIFFGNKKNNLTESKLIIPTPTPEVSPVNDQNIFTDIKGKFSMEIPPGWTQDKKISPELGVKIVSPEKVDITGIEFHPSITIINQMALGRELEDYTQEAIQLLEESFKDFKLISNSPVMVKNQPGNLLESSYTQGVYPMKDLQLLLIYQDTAYVITGSDLEIHWDKTKEQLKQALMSFELK